jgi:hypothetical protein
LDEKRRCLAATLLSVITLSLSGKPKILNKKLEESFFKNIPVHLHSFLAVIVHRNAVCFGILQ